ncbi:hypothetical protein VNI00_002188 [Paramarasmius palmivorus]|uniref:Uncharacterized protein n=1 Tax=Paramarasmius palmivorus TaxID=297713 RepID=A0AAW0E3Z0_9AGAR
MSLHTLGMNDVTDEMQAFKDKLGSKEAQIAAQQGQLIKKAAELEEIRASFNDAVRKLNEETQRALQLESNLHKCSEDLRNEKILSENHKSALNVAQEKFKAKDLEARELEATLESMSHTSNGHNAKVMKMEKEKGVLEARVRELEANLRQLSSPPVTPGKLRTPRPRSSSLSNFRITSLEAELSEARTLLGQKDADLQSATKRLDTVQRELFRANNENMALDARNRKRIQELEALVDEKDEELEYLRNEQDGQGREEELLRRIDEDEAKIEALERLVGEASEVPSLKKKLRQAEQQVILGAGKLSQAESKNAELVQEKEEALDHLETARNRVTALEATIRERDEKIAAMGQPSGMPIQEEQAVQSMERLLNAVDRLRGERDALQRDLDFVSAESKFRIAALEAKVGESTGSSCGGSGTAVETPSKQSPSLGKAILACMIVVGHLHNTLTASADDLSRALAANMQQANLPSGQEGRLKQTEDRLQTTLESLEEATTHRNDLLSQLEEANASHEDTRSSLMRADGEISELSNALQEVESERDSLSLQVTNLTNDLKAAQEELAEAEKRYSSLQFHQLSNMSSTEATSALRRQIQELEGKVSRRNEQLGIQIHDIRRLETNLKLQEERLTEMTAEMETLASQKEAMVEDCADAREARDDAIARVEVLEEEVERVESQLEENERSLASLVAVAFHTVSRSREKVRLAEERVRSAKECAEYIQREQDSASRMGSELESVVREKDSHLKDTEEDIRRVTLALAVSQNNLRQTSHSINALIEEKAHLAATVKGLQREISSQAADKEAIASELKALRAGSSDDLRAKVDKITELEAEVKQLREMLAETERSHSARVDELEVLISQKDEQLASNDLEGEVVQLKMKHVEEIGQLQSQLVKSSAALEEMKAQQAAKELEYEEKLSASMRSGRTLQNELSDISEDLAKSRQSEQMLTTLKLQQEKKIQQLEVELSTIAREAQELRHSNTNTETSLNATIDDVTRQRNELEGEVQQLKREAEDALARLEASRTDLAQASTESSALSDKLKEEAEAHAHEKSLLQGELLSQRSQSQRMESQLEDLLVQMADIGDQLKRSESELELSRADGHKLQCDMTALEAEIQRAISYNRYLESQVKESEQKIARLHSELESVQNDLVSAQKACNTAEMNLNLQSAQHKREMSNLNRELASLKARPNLEEALAELEQRNNEMEELLRRKCAEIEENDDRAIEMLKDNKKLTSKVETLTRKVQNLQAKLAAAKASGPSVSDTRASSSSPPSHTPSDPPMQPRTTRNSTSRASVLSPQEPERVQSSTVFQARTRAHSSASTMHRDSTPEASSVPVPVFKAITPKRRSVDIDVPPSVMTGKKRSAPEDFETNQSVPAQAFTADSVPGDKAEPSTSTTPRVRRVLSNIQSGFTPVRHRTPTAPVPAPAEIQVPKEAVARAVSVNPVPLDPKVSKRGSGWLGKIRGASSHPRS